ncbi:MAF-like septum formation protein [Perkinsela sp. CCAP 1560/4]|nr:MAF-like septum formation protein [Perkinsela sp. CCAP 1560/4]|eukprot:KNH07496.1 MAF-like septum formation protein [Perkinsela sp. CCAP 1560/4]
MNMSDKKSLFDNDDLEKLARLRVRHGLCIILGSRSASRLAVFQEWFPNTIFPAVFQLAPDIDEKATRSDDPYELTLEITKRKNRAVLEKFTRMCADHKDWPVARPCTVLFITSDQVSVFRDENGLEIREKPTSEEENKAFLQSYSNSMVETCGTLCVHRFHMESMGQPKIPDKSCYEYDVNRVHFNTISDEVIHRVVSRGESIYCSGGFVVEDEDLAQCVKHIDGCVEGVMGLNPFLLKQMIFDVLFPPSVV